MRFLNSSNKCRAFTRPAIRRVISKLTSPKAPSLQTRHTDSLSIYEPGGDYMIPPRRNIKELWKYDCEHHEHRHVIEYFSISSNLFRRVDICYNKITYFLLLCLRSFHRFAFITYTLTDFSDTP